MISADQARSAILERVPVLGTVTLSIRRAAGYRLADDVVASSDVPPFENAAMDGYAVRSAEA
ncbi:MAG TPA: molybdopterin molybdenumtransferase MoeA, partial [Bacteroidota bacterium]|nr:molybdopterin molybdenumtransferase MoeA [Bacteroidota bacterium]